MPFTNHQLTPDTFDPTTDPKRRCTRYQDEPSYSEASGLWLYGNVRLLHGKLAYIEKACSSGPWSRQALEDIEQETEDRVLSGEILVCGIHNEAHQRAAVVPLRWGAPRIIVFSGGLRFHLGVDLRQEPFRAARLWRYQWDPRTDLGVSRRAPSKQPTFARYNSTVDKLIQGLANGTWIGLFGSTDTLSPLVRPLT